MFTQEEIDKSVEVIDHLTEIGLLECERLYPRYSDFTIQKITHDKITFCLEVKYYYYGDYDTEYIYISENTLKMGIEEYKASIKKLILEQKIRDKEQRKKELIAQEQEKIRKQKQAEKEEKLLYQKLKLKYEK